MKTLYNTLMIKAVMVCMLATMMGCSTSRTYQEALSRNEQKIDDPARMADARFVVDAKSFNMLEMRLAEIALTSGYSSAVVDLARTHLEEHKQMEDDIQSLARKEKIVLPSVMSNEHLVYLNEVSNTDRSDFDRDFIKTMQRINDENKEQYLNMATEANDPDVRAFSARKLDLLRSHATRMGEVEKKLMNTY